MKFISLIFIFISLFWINAYADGGFYTGIGVGAARLNNKAQENQVLGNSGAQNANGDALASNLYFGYDFNHFVGLEEEYLVAFNSNIANSYSANQQVLATEIALHLPFGIFSSSLNGLNIFAKGGMGYEMAQFSGMNGCFNCVNPSNQYSSFVPVYGAGVEYGFTNVGYRLEWDGIGSMTNVNQGMNQVALSSNMLLLSIMYHF